MKSLKSERLTILLHVLAWAILFLFPFIGRETYPLRFVLKSAFHIVVLASFFYVNLLVLIPKFLFNKKTSLYIFTVCLGMVFVISSYILFDELWQNKPRAEHHAAMPHRQQERSFDRMGPPKPISMKIIFPLISFLMVFGVSTSLRTINEYLKKEELQKETETEKLNAELAFLKSQINPHFLFNTLNNLFSLAHSRSDKTANAIMKLSELMRYMVEDTGGRKVELYRELEYIKNYLELQRLRLDDSVKVELTIEGDFHNKSIEPLLLIPFIENAFKHGVSYNESSFVHIELISNDHQVMLKMENSIPSQKMEKDEASGIGLTNVRKRLELLYPKAYKLNIIQNKSKYIVELTINL